MRGRFEGKGHIGGSFSATDLLVALYQGGLLRFNLEATNWEQRDRFIMSKGHSSEALYAVLADAGFFDVDILATYGKDNTLLGGHPDRGLPGIEVSTGSAKSPSTIQRRQTAWSPLARSGITGAGKCSN